MNSKNIESYITDDSSRDNFRKIAKIMNKRLGISFIDVPDIKADYIDYSDTVYWDFKYKDILLTLHLEHYTGIMIMHESTTPSKTELETSKEVADKVLAIYNK